VSLAARLSGTVLFTELRFRFVVAFRPFSALLSFDNAAEPHISVVSGRGVDRHLFMEFGG
jgi:hypothetical protein